MERRFTHSAMQCKVENRADGTKVIKGYAAVFYKVGVPGTQYERWSGMTERIEAGAFTDALMRPDDVRGLFNHDANKIIGRNLSKTLRLSQDDTGLLYEIDLPPTQLAADLASSIERGDVSGSSFAFSVDRVDWSTEGDLEVRTIKAVTLYDVGPVTYPAYSATSAGVRGGLRGDAELVDEYRAWKESQSSVLGEIRRRKAASLRLLDTISTKIL